VAWTGTTAWSSRDAGEGRWSRRAEVGGAAGDMVKEASVEPPSTSACAFHLLAQEPLATCEPSPTAGTTPHHKSTVASSPCPGRRPPCASGSGVAWTGTTAWSSGDAGGGRWSRRDSSALGSRSGLVGASRPLCTFNLVQFFYTTSLDL
jgi:hypothetical protein